MRASREGRRRVRKEGLAAAATGFSARYGRRAPHRVGAADCAQAPRRGLAIWRRRRQELGRGQVGENTTGRGSPTRRHAGRPAAGRPAAARNKRQPSTHTPEGGRGWKRSGPLLGLLLSRLATRDAAVAEAFTLACAAILVAACVASATAAEDFMSSASCAVGGSARAAFSCPGIRTGSEPGAQLSMGGGTGSSPVCQPGSAAASLSPGSRLRKLSCGAGGRRRARGPGEGVRVREAGGGGQRRRSCRSCYCVFFGLLSLSLCFCLSVFLSFSLSLNLFPALDDGRGPGSPPRRGSGASRRRPARRGPARCGQSPGGQSPPWPWPGRG